MLWKLSYFASSVNASVPEAEGWEAELKGNASVLALLAHGPLVDLGTFIWILFVEVELFQRCIQ